MMKKVTISLLLAGLLLASAWPAEAKTTAPRAELGWAGRMKVRLAPVRVYKTPRALSRVSLGLQGKQRIVKAVVRQLPDGRQVRKAYGTKIVGNKRHRSVMSTVIRPDGTATYTLNVKGLLKRSWTGTEDYRPLKRGRAVAGAVMSSPATKTVGVTLLVGGAVATLNPAASAAAIAKAMALPSVYTGAVIAGSSAEQLKPSVQSLDQ